MMTPFHQILYSDRAFSLITLTGLCLGLCIGLLAGMGFAVHLFILFSSLAFLIYTLTKLQKAFIFFIISYPIFATLVVALGGGIPDVSYHRMYICLLLLVVILRTSISNFRLEKISKYETLMGFFSIFAFTSMYMNYGTEELIQNTLTFVDNFIIPFIFFFLARNLLKNEKSFSKLALILIIPAVYLSLMAIYEQITLQDLFPVTYTSDTHKSVQGLRIENTGIMRANGPFYYPETLGVVLVMLALFLTYHFDKKVYHGHSTPLKNILIITFPLLALGLYCNKFRSIWLGLVIGLIFRFGIYSKHRIKLIMILVFTVIMTTVSLPYLKSTDIYQNRISNMGTLHERIATVKSAYAMFVDNPLIGVGSNNFSNMFLTKNYKRSFKGQTSVSQAHNSYFCLLVENGITGFFLFILILFIFFKDSLKSFCYPQNNHQKNTAAVSLGLLSSLTFISFFDTVTLWANVNILFYTLMGAAMAQFEPSADKVFSKTSAGNIKIKS